MREVPDTYPKSTVHEKLEFDNALTSFTGLKEKYINWHSGRAGITSEIETDMEQSSDDDIWPPFPKRTKKL